MAMTDDELAVVRSYVGDVVEEDDLQDRHDRLDNIDLVIVETLRHKQAQLVNDNPATLVVDGITINQADNMREMQKMIDEFINSGGTGLEDTQAVVGDEILGQTRPDRDDR